MSTDVETPAYVYDLTEVRDNVTRLTGALPDPSGLYYSLKANAHPVLLETLRGEGVQAEVCSAGELAAALRAGWPAGEILYGGPGKRDDDVRDAIRLGVRHFSADSPAALDQLNHYATLAGARCRTLLRINDDTRVPGQGLAMTGVASAFGADLAWVVADPAAFTSRSHVTVGGLHLYMGTNLTTVDDLIGQFTQTLRAATTAAAALAPHGVRLDVLDLGGGFGAPFARAGTAITLDGLRDRLGALLDEQAPGWRHGRPRIAFESGRYLVGTAGRLLTRVLDVKQSQGRNVIVLESGVNHLGGMSGLRRLPPLQPELAVPDDRAGAATVETVVCGPLCTPLDVWSRTAQLPPLKAGDVLAVPNVGAYGLTASLVGFLGHALPGEYVIDTARTGSAVVHHSRLHLDRSEGNHP
jgi:diaminopimelate decarboxylase